MTYCLAWKKYKTVYMIADTCISAIDDKVNSEVNTFGECQGLYGKYYVQEGELKIYKITPNLAISYSGDIKQCKEIIEAVYHMANEFNTNKVMEIIENSFHTYNVEMIFIFSDDFNNYIYKFSKGTFKECDYAEIGNGKEIPYLSKDIKGVIDELYSEKLDKEYYLSMIISTIQCYILKNNIFKFGVGGVITGIFINKKLKWFRDIEYCLFEDDIRDLESMSVIVRGNSVFSSSDLDGGTRYIINNIIDKQIWDDLYLRKGIIKSLNTKNAFYYVFYSKKYNVLYFMRTNGYLHNIHFRRYVRRNEKTTDYVYVFRPDFRNHFIELDSNNERMPSVVEMQVIQKEYISHKEIIKRCSKDDISKRGKYLEMDFDFSEMEYKDFDKSLVIPIKKIINNYHNIVLLDYEYLCNSIEEKVNLYKQFHDFTIDDLNLEAIINRFMKQIVEHSFDKYLFCAVKSMNYTKEILDCNMDDYLKKYKNFKIISTNNFMNDFNGFIFELMKNYYINDLFFHLDKFIIIADNQEVRELLDIITPRFNFECTNPDIFLVRNLNELTEMNGELRYMVIDYVVAEILGLSIEEFGMLESLSYNI